MPTILILHEADHKVRGDALMNSLAHAAASEPIDYKPVAINGLRTLIFWGHGSHTGLCGKTGAEILKIIGKWRDLNDKLRTVEIITCNSRHFDDSWLANTKPEVHLKSYLAHLGGDSQINNSMAKQIKRGLKYSWYPSLRKITVKTMPESLTGAYKHYSILLWDDATSTWCYVISTTEPAMFELCNHIKLTKKMPPDPHRKWGPARTGNLQAKLAAAQMDFPAADYSDVQAGGLATLRGILVDVD